MPTGTRPERVPAGVDAPRAASTSQSAAPQTKQLDPAKISDRHALRNRHARIWRAYSSRMTTTLPLSGESQEDHAARFVAGWTRKALVAPEQPMTSPMTPRMAPPITPADGDTSPHRNEAGQLSCLRGDRPRRYGGGVSRRAHAQRIEQAIKVLRLDKARDPAAVTRLRREALVYRRVACRECRSHLTAAR